MIARPEFRSAVARAVEKANAQLGQTEKVRKFILSQHPFTIENGQMTPTLKVRRHAVIREFQDKLETLYK